MEDSNPAPAPQPAEKPSKDPVLFRPRARGLKRAKSGSDLTPEEVPVLDTAARRIAWIAERMAAGLYVTGDHIIAAKKWGLKPRTVEHHVETASKIVEYSTGDLEKLRNLSMTRLESIAAAEGPDRLRAVQTALQVTGLLRGGALDNPSNGTLTAEQADYRMVSAIRCPDSRMLGILRAAFQQANPKLRALLDEFTGVLGTGVTLPDTITLQPVTPSQ
jgi:hypothetical protein